MNVLTPSLLASTGGGRSWSCLLWVALLLLLLQRRRRRRRAKSVISFHLGLSDTARRNDDEIAAGLFSYNSSFGLLHFTHLYPFIHAGIHAYPNERNAANKATTTSVPTNRWIDGWIPLLRFRPRPARRLPPRRDFDDLEDSLPYTAGLPLKDRACGVGNAAPLMIGHNCFLLDETNEAAAAAASAARGAAVLALFFSFSIAVQRADASFLLGSQDES
jgi:hypothetical protein